MSGTHKAIKDYGVDAVTGKDQGDSHTNTELPESMPEDESNYPHIESFVNDLKDHELHHAMYHAAVKLGGKDAHKEGSGPESDVSMDDFKKLKESD